MLNFIDIETKRLSDIVNVGAGHILNDLKFLDIIKIIKENYGYKRE